MIITINHVRAFGYCAKGARAFFKAHQLDWQRFLVEGIEDNQLLATGDDLAIKLVEHVKMQGDSTHGDV